MPSVADCLRQHAPAYLQRFADRVPTGHRKVIAAITRCRTGALGGIHYRCERCGRHHWVGRSRGNRHCPNCGKEKTYAWLDSGHAPRREPTSPPQPRCSQCGGVMCVIGITFEPAGVLTEHALAYLDSG